MNDQPKGNSERPQLQDGFNLSKTTLLLGSGISKPSGYPLTAEITNALFSKNWLFDQDQARVPYPLNDLEGVYLLKTQGIYGLLKILRAHIDQHLAIQGKGEANYEDLYFLAQQLLDSLKGEYDNPGLMPLLFDLRTTVSLMASNLNANRGLFGLWGESIDLDLTELLEKGTKFIEESVASHLSPREEIKGLEFLDQLLVADQKSPLHLVSLNHDTLIETYLSAHKVSDGFVQISTEAAEFQPDSFEGEEPYRVRLLKLHGSINWFRYQTVDSRENRILKISAQDRDHVTGLNDEKLFPPNDRLMLSGTTNKELAYGSGVFIELMFQFQKRLKETDLLIVSGYGFADKGINNRLWAWLDTRPKNRIVVLHENIDELRRDAKPSFSSNMERHKGTGKFVLVDKWMCDSSLDDLIRELRLSHR